MYHLYVCHNQHDNAGYRKFLKENQNSIYRQHGLYQKKSIHRLWSKSTTFLQRSII